MSCNGCRVLRKGCSESCILRPCLDWIKSAQCQANATAFLAKFYGRTGLINLISNGPQHSRPALFRSLLYEACGRILNPIYGSVGLLWSGNWAACQAGVESILQGMYPVSKAVNTFDNPNEEHQNIVHGGTLMKSIASELHKVKAKGKFKCVNPRRKAIKPRKAQFPNNVEVSSGVAEGRRGGDIRKTFQDTLIFRGNDVFTHSEEKGSSDFMALELTLGASSPHKLAD